MKKLICILLAIAMIMTLGACGQEKQNDLPAEQVEEKTEESAETEYNTAKANGYTVKIISATKTNDQSGNVILAVKMQFTNENAEPAAFNSVANINCYQDGAAVHRDQIFLLNNYDWDSANTEIKDGETINVYCPIPVDDVNKQAEIVVELYNMESITPVASAAVVARIDELEIEAGSSQSVSSNGEDEAWDNLAALGQVKIENGLLTATITLPPEFLNENITQEEIDSRAGPAYISGHLNEDGSVTYMMTKGQHKAMLDSFMETIDAGLADLISDGQLAFTDINYNEDLTVYDVYLSTNQVGIYEGITAYALFFYSGYYGILAGKTPENVVINFYGLDGNYISSLNSNDLRE
ncbi:MAG: DUF5067 domain-containing protein [Oscillospiraceae bacterium]|nr:DUF5067 domain-containing protein [Oscillospiraceae bacterium]